jgi:fumarate hydratase class II
MATRVEKDTFGEVQVPDEALWGAQTARSLANFPIGEERFSRPLIHAFGVIKRAAAETNGRLGRLDARAADLLARAAAELAEGGLDDQFPLSVWQTGSGTQTHMNVNEVLANRAAELGGGARGSREFHPNDHANRSQSTNDVFPTAIHVAAAIEIEQRLVPAVRRLRDTLDRKAVLFADIVKIGRTHLQDATPLTLGQEISGWVAQLDHGLARLEASQLGLFELAIGGTAVGTGIGSPPEWAERMADRIAELTGLPFRPAPNKFEALAARDAAAFASGALRTLAGSLLKISTDVRLLSSGPRSGLGEIRIPENEPGSSIMPGKVNPTQAEALAQVALQVFGNDATIALAAASGNFELNAFLPVIAFDLLQSIRILGDACSSFEARCAAGIEPDRERIAELVDRSLMLVTALAPRIGYDAAARIAKEAHESGRTLREAALASGLVSAEEFEELVRPERMIAPER